MDPKDTVSVLVTRLLASVKGQTGKRGSTACRQRLKCDGTLAETRFRLLAKQASPFKPAGASVQSIAGSRDVRMSGSNGSNAGHTIFQGSVEGTGYPLFTSFPFHFPSRASPCAITFQLDSTTKHFLSVSKTSTVIEAMDMLPTQYMFLKEV